ncbi:MAG TPA: HAD-IC family P-type ATPase [Chloroflexota bacterium]|nr:HAD-IC family P-type ATPase [Chloroflexota bacterium]
MVTPPLSVHVRSLLPDRLRVEIPALRGDLQRAAGVAAALRQLSGVVTAGVNPVTGRALLCFSSPIEDVDTLLTTIARAAAQPLPPPLEELRPAPLTQTEPLIGRDWVRVVAGGLAVGALAVLRLAGGPLILGSPPVVILATGAALIVGLPTFVSGLRPLLRLEPPEIDTLITTATFASLLVGEAAAGLVVVWLIALGELIEELTLNRTRQEIAGLLSVGEEWAWVVVGGEEALQAASNAGHENVQEIRVRREEIEAGSLVVVHAGEKIPVDGLVIRGGASVNQAPITGESLPVFRNPGDEVYAGTLLIGGSLLIRATRVGGDTAIARIIRLVEETRDVQAPVQRLADRFSRRIVPLSFLLAGAVFALTGDVLRSMTILVIACPCAAGLSTPTAVSAAIANAARRGVLIKGGLYLELAGDIDAVVFDKTGTLTAGAPRLTRILTVDGRYTPERILALAASGELHSQHPLATAVLRHTVEQEIEIPAHSDYEIIVGHGVRFAVDGTRLVIGSRHMLEDFGVQVQDTVEGMARRLREHGETVMWVAEIRDGTAMPAEHAVRQHPGGEPDDMPVGSVAQPSARGSILLGAFTAGTTGRSGEEARGPTAAEAGQQTSMNQAASGKVIGLIGVADIIRSEAREALARLREAGVEHIYMITGDSQESASIVGQQLGLESEAIIAQALPEEKFDLVRRLQQEGRRVALVGDGINDAPALAAANVGIAMGHGGADIALEAADIALAANDIRHVAEVIRLSRHTMSLVRQNFAFSLGINGLGVLAGAFGLLSPFTAALLHNLSTVAVVLNSGRLLSWGGERLLLPPPAGSASTASITPANDTYLSVDDVRSP